MKRSLLNFKNLILTAFLCILFSISSSINAQSINGVYGNGTVSLTLEEVEEGVIGLFTDSDGAYYEATFFYDDEGLIGILGDYYAVIPYDDNAMNLYIMPKDANEEPIWDDAVEYQLQWISALETTQQPIDYSQLNWVPIKRFGSDFYPSYVLATSTWSKDLVHESEEQNYTYFGDGNGYFGIQINQFPVGSIVRVEIEGEPLVKKSSYTITVPNDGMIEIFPQMEYDFDGLRNINQAKAVNFKFSIYINDELLGENKEVVWTRSVNDAIFYGMDHHGNGYPLDFIYAAYVNENEPMVDVVLGEMLDYKIVDSWAGYQKDEDFVLLQVFAMWHYFQKKGFKYSSITTQSGFDEKSQGQVVRFVKDALNTSQANCIDGTVLFASFLYKIGIDVSIVLVPGHAYLAFSLDEEGKNIKALETVMLGDDDIENKVGAGSISTDLQTRNEEFNKSYSTFASALNVATDDFLTNAIPGIESKDPRYMILNIKEARKRKVRPIK